MPYQIKNNLLTFLTLFAFAIIGMASQGYAQGAMDADNKPVDIIPAHTLEGSEVDLNAFQDTHGPLKLTPDKSELIRLPEKAGSIIIGNPDHLSILADSAKTLVLVPKLPGATSVTVLNMEGKLLLQRHVIVSSPKEKYVRIRKSCASGTEGCEATSVYYCPDMCHKVTVPTLQDAKASEDAQQPGLEGVAGMGAGAASSQETVDQGPAN